MRRIGGVYLVTLVIALAAALAAHARRRARTRCTRGQRVCVARRHRAARGGRGRGCRTSNGRTPAGAPLAVSLVQGNVLQDLKFDPQFRAATFERYLRLVEQSRGRLVVLPESAFPMFSDEIPDAVLLSLIRMASARNGDVLLGLFTAEPPEPGGDEPRYYNTRRRARRLRRCSSTAKNHLVPFGETIPLKPLIGWFIRSVLHIPLADSGARRRRRSRRSRRRPARRRQHLLRGRVRRRARSAQRARRDICSST